MSALLEIEELEVSFGGRTAAVRGASFRVEKGETHCLVGESGCGKSVTALAVMSLLARGGQRSAKKMSFAGTDLTSLSDREMARLRGNRMAMIFQEPMTSLNPAFTIGSQMAEVLTRHVRQYRRLRAVLDRELAVEPLPESEATYRLALLRTVERSRARAAALGQASNPKLVAVNA